MAEAMTPRKLYLLLRQQAWDRPVATLIGDGLTETESTVQTIPKQ